MTQLITKFIADNAATGAKMRLNNNETFRAKKADGTDIDLFALTAANLLEFKTLPAALATLPVPTSAKQVAAVEYINNFVKGKGDPKDAVDALADSNIALTGTTTLVVDSLTVPMVHVWV